MGYIYNGNNIFKGFSSDACLGRIDEEGYVYNGPNTWHGFGSNACIGRVDDNGYVYNGHNIWNGFGSNTCVGRVDDNGYVYNGHNIRNGFSSDACVGRVDLDENYLKAGAALLLILLPSICAPSNGASDIKSINPSNNSSLTSPISAAKSSAKSTVSDILVGIVSFFGLIVIAGSVMAVHEFISEREFNKQKNFYTELWYSEEDEVNALTNSVVLNASSQKLGTYPISFEDKERVEFDFTAEGAGAYWFEVQNMVGIDSLALEAFDGSSMKITGLYITENGHGIYCKSLEANEIVRIVIQAYSKSGAIDLVTYYSPSIEVPGYGTIRGDIIQKNQENRYILNALGGCYTFDLETDPNNEFSFGIYDSNGKKIEIDRNCLKYLNEQGYSLQNGEYYLYVTQEEGMGEYTLKIQHHSVYF